MAYKIVLDAGHGGSDSGNTYGQRIEKEDVLKIVLALGKILEDSGAEIEYTRIDDVYNTPYEKAMMANNTGADIFISIHRNISDNTNENGVETLVFRNNGVKSVIADNINSQMEKMGFKSLGIKERPNLVLLKETEMPAVLVEAGFISSNKDNELLDTKMNAIADAIADGILDAVNVDMNNQQANFLYRVQVGAFRNKEAAYKLMERLQETGFQSFVVLDDNLYKVQVGAFEVLDNAVKMERSLRDAGYGTFITTK